MVTTTGVAFGMTYPFVPLLARALGASPWAIGFIGAANVPAMLLVDGLGTRAIARLDSKHVLISALVSFGIGSAMATSAPDLWVLLASRLFEGAGIALFMTGGIHLVTRHAAEHARGRAIGTFNACWFLGAAAGPLLGGLLTVLLDGTSGVRLVFGACAAVSVACAALIAVALPSYPGIGAPRISLPPLRSLGGDRRLLRAIALGGHAEAVRDGFMMVVLPLAAVTAGLTDLSVGVALTAMALADVVSMHVSGYVADRYGRVRPLCITLVVAACVALAGTRVDDLAGFWILATALGAALGTAWVVPPTMVLDLADDHEAAITGYRLSSDIGLFVGVSGSGALLEVFGPRGVFSVLAVVLLAGGALAASVGETRARVLPPIPTPMEVPL